MPNRIFKDSYKSSPQVNELNWFEQCVWTRLILSADDFGRFDGRPIVLKHELFPADENVSKAAVEKAIKHMASIDLIRLYTVGERPYLYIPTWKKHQRTRAHSSKYPAPDSQMTGTCQSDDSQMTGTCGRIRNTNTNANAHNRISSYPSSAASAVMSENEDDEERMKWFDEWWEEYPRKVGKGKCRDKYLRIVTDEDKHVLLLGAIRKQNEVYKTKPVQYIPYPETWLNQERWEDELQPDTERPKDKEQDWSVFDEWPAQ